MKDIVRRKAAIADLTDAEKATVTNALVQNGVEIVQAPGQDLAAAYAGLQAGYLFVS